MGPWFEVNRWWDRYKQKNEVAFGNLTHNRTHHNVQFQTPNGTYKNKRKKETKKVLDLSKLTLFGIRDRTTIKDTFDVLNRCRVGMEFPFFK